MLRVLFLFLVLLTGCGNNSTEDNFWYDLKKIPLSDELKKYIDTNATQSTNSQTEKYLALEIEIQRPETRTAASKELLELWESDPTNFLWIDLAVLYNHLLKNSPREEKFSELIGSKNTAVSDFIKARWNYGYGTHGEYYEKAHSKQSELSETNKLWLNLKYASVLDDRGESEAAAYLLLENITICNDSALESIFWDHVARFLLKSDHLDDALHASKKSWLLATDSSKTNCMITFATILEARQEYTPALDALDRCIADATENNLPWLTSRALNNAAALCGNISQLQMALDYDKQSLKVNLETNDTLNIPRSFMNIAYDLRLLGELDSCIVYMEKAKLWVDKYNEPSNKFGLPMYMAEYFCQIGDYAKADSLLNCALKQLGQTGLPHDEAELHLKMIRQGLEMNQPSVAYQSIDRLKELQSVLYNEMPDQNLIAEYEIATADFLAQQGEFMLAFEAHQRAEVSVNKKSTENIFWSLLRSKGELAIIRKDYSSAKQYFTNCLSVATEAQNPDLIATSRLNLGKLLLDSGNYNQAIQLLSESEKNSFGGRFKTRLQALLYSGIAYSSAGNNQQSLIKINRALSLCNEYSPADIVAKLLLERSRLQPSTAKQDLIRASELIRNSIIEELPGFNLNIVQEIAIELAGLEVDNGDIGLRSLKAALSVLQNNPTIDFPEYNLIFYLTGQERSFRWYIANNKVAVEQLPGKNDLLRLTESLIADPDLKSNILPSNIEKGALCIIPDNPLTALPWYALAVSESERLIDIVTLVEAPSWSHLSDYGPLPELMKMLSIGVNKADGMDTLKEAQAEAISVGKIWPTHLTTTLTGRKADLGKEPESLLSQFQIIHIASHAKVHQGLPSRSTLRLAGNNSAPLTITAVAKMSLNAELVYLSSCEAARDVSTTGAVANFASAFLDAGVNSVIASTVPVNDEAGRFLAEHFYRNLLAGHSKSKSLAMALNKLRATPEWNDPYYWGFVRMYGSF